MKEFKTFNQQLTILRNRGMTVPTDGRPKRFLEQENYYNVINGYKDLFLRIRLKQLFHMNFRRNIQKRIHIWILQIIEMMIQKVF